VKRPLRLRKASPDSLVPAGNKDGMALVLTLMIVAIITAMVVEFAYGIYTNTTSLSNWKTSQQLSLAARSTVKLAARLIAEQAQKTDTNGTFSISQAVPFGDLDTTVTLSIEDENAKFNLNSLVTPNGKLDTNGRPEQFVKLLQALKLPTSIADRVIDWIDPDSEPRLPGSETGAKNAYLDSVDELLQIPGIDRKTYERLLPYVTIYGTGADQGGYVQGLININDASLPVLMSLPGIDESMAERVIEYRKITPFTVPTDITKVAGFGTVGIALGGSITTGRSVFHVTATAESGGIKRTIDSVLEVSGISATVRYWKEM
jgi:general secretion pathway protein K